MYPVPRKYDTTCVEKVSGSVLSNRVFEAINSDEAGTRALLSCMGEEYRPDDLSIRVERR